MSVITKVRALHVTNTSPALANIILLESDGTAIPLNPGAASIHPDNALIIDLTTVKALNDGDMFTIRVRMSHSGQVADNDTVLTYVDDSTKQGTYTVEGDAVAPKINYVGLEVFTAPAS